MKSLSRSEYSFITPQNVLYELSIILHETVKFFEKNNSVYIAFQGTLLGAVRHQNLIPWEVDADLCIFDSALMDKQTTIQHFNRLGYHVLHKYPYMFKICKQSYLKKNKIQTCKYPSIDICIMQVDKNGVFHIPGFTDPRWINELKFNDIFPIIQLPFQKYQISCPNKFKSYLHMQYKNWNHEVVIPFIWKDNEKGIVYLDKPIKFKIHKCVCEKSEKSRLMFCNKCNGIASK